jgi:hypothetical protein
VYHLSLYFTFTRSTFNMGNDGGSIPKRRELVKEAAKALTTSQAKEQLTEQQEYHWSTCPLSRKPLAAPVVSDAAGALYNKDAVIEFLLAEDGREKEEAGKVADMKRDGEFAELGCAGDRLKGLKDVVEVKFEIGQERTTEASGRRETWMCPITGRELGPGAKAVYIVPCGHAFAGSVVKEVAGSACLQVRQSQDMREGRDMLTKHSATSRTPRTTLSQFCRRYRPISRASICESKHYERRDSHTHSRKRQAAKSARRTPTRKQTAAPNQTVQPPPPNPNPRLTKTRRRNPRQTA